MFRFLPVRFRLAAIIGCILSICLLLQDAWSMTSNPKLLTDPFLQLPTPISVNVVWFTEFSGVRHTVSYGQNLEQAAIAPTTQLSHTREDADSRVGSQMADGKVYAQTQVRPIWRHEAKISGLLPNQRIPYRVNSLTTDGKIAISKTFRERGWTDSGDQIRISYSR